MTVYVTCLQHTQEPVEEDSVTWCLGQRQSHRLGLWSLGACRSLLGLSEIAS